MARREKTQAAMAVLGERFKDVAGQFAEELKNREGGVLEGKFVDLEDLAVGIGQEVGRQLLRNFLMDQAAAADDEPCRCETCGRVCETRPVRKRKVATQSGEVTWNEPVRYCRPCRRSFSPSVEPLGAGHSQRT